MHDVSVVTERTKASETRSCTASSSNPSARLISSKTSLLYSITSAQKIELSIRKLSLNLFTCSLLSNQIDFCSLSKASQSLLHQTSVSSIFFNHLHVFCLRCCVFASMSVSFGFKRGTIRGHSYSKGSNCSNTALVGKNEISFIQILGLTALMCDYILKYQDRVYNSMPCISTLILN